MLRSTLLVSVGLASPLEDLREMHQDQVDMIKKYVPEPYCDEALKAAGRKYRVFEHFLKDNSTAVLKMTHRFEKIEKEIKDHVPSGEPRESALDSLLEDFFGELMRYNAWLQHQNLTDVYSELKIAVGLPLENTSPETGSTETTEATKAPETGSTETTEATKALNSVKTDPAPTKSAEPLAPTKKTKDLQSEVERDARKELEGKLDVLRAKGELELRKVREMGERAMAKIKRKAEKALEKWLEESKKFANKTIENKDERASVIEDIQRQFHVHQQEFQSNHLLGGGASDDDHHDHETQFAAGAAYEEGTSSIFGTTWLVCGLLMGSIVAMMVTKKYLSRNTYESCDGVNSQYFLQSAM